MLATTARRALRRLDRMVVGMQAARLRARYPGVRSARRGVHWYVAVPEVPLRPADDLLRDVMAWLVDAAESAGVECLVVPGARGGPPHVSVESGRIPALISRLDVPPGVLLLARPRGARTAKPLSDLGAGATCPVEVFRPVCVADGGLVTGPEEGCLLVEHHRDDDWVRFGVGNGVAERVPIDLATPATVEIRGDTWPTLGPLAATDRLDAVEFPIDAVYTWVDGSDPDWRAERDEHLHVVGTPSSDEAANPSRWLDREELRYSLRSLHLFAPWIRHVWLVTAGHVPDWLDVDNTGLTVVTHAELFKDPSVLPTFNSHAIETQLHRIPGLAEHYLYMNDDVHFGRPVRPEQFFLSNGVPKFFPSRHQLDPGSAMATEPPVMAAGKNGRELIATRYGRVVTQKLKHTPHPQRRQVVAELVDTFSDAVARTAASRFRAPSDVSIASSLIHHFGYVTERAVPSWDLAYMYLNLMSDDFDARLERLERERHLDAFCINDTSGQYDHLRRRGDRLRAFLEAYFPSPSPYERGGTTRVGK